MDSTLACLAAWMPRQRWYTSKGSAPALRLVTAWDMPTDDASARVRTLLVVDDNAAPRVLYQVPLVLRVAAEPSLAPHIVGTTEDGVTLVDGPHDPAYTSALRRAVAPDLPAGPSTVLSGEQSNTSIIYSPAGVPPVICKVFRQVNPGLNPDIELQTALAGAGSSHVPRAVGHVESTWPDPADPTRTLTGSLAFAQEFLPGVEDAWRVALRAAAEGVGFSEPAYALGAATADVHLSLCRLFPTAPADDAARGAIAAAWERRLQIAADEVPGLARHRAAIAAVYARATATVWPALQRVHGDYHLGQVLHVPGRGWVLLDFEGEPMRPMSERRGPDLALRDVAGMLRSFDYVAATLHRERPEHDAAAGRWAAEARTAFLGGYEHRSGTPATGPLLDACELDKAVYEAIYESRNRPDWLGIPLAAITRLVGRA